MTTSGTVRFWLCEDGWGVIDSPQTPGGCWAHFSSVRVAGYAALAAGQPVRLDWEAADHDGYRFPARRVWPAGSEPVSPPDAGADTTGHHSRLTLRFDSGRTVTREGDDPLEP